MKATASTPTKQGEVFKQMLQECEAMARHSLASGAKVSGALIQTIESARDTSPDAQKPSATALSRVHSRLAETVAPATPRTILLLALEAEKPGLLKFLGRVPLVRRMMVAALFFLVCFVTISLSPDVNETGGDILKDSGLSLLLNQLFFVSAAGLGAAFAALFKANRYVVQGTFDPKYESSYWIRFTLGIIAGMLLAVLIPLDTGAEAAPLGKPLLAMLGGFSAALVHRILNRLVDTVESLVRGGTEDLVAGQVRALQARADEQTSGARLKMAGGLMDLKQELAGGDMAALKEKLDKLVGDLVPMGEDEEELEAAAATTADKA